MAHKYPPPKFIPGAFRTEQYKYEVEQEENEQRRAQFGNSAGPEPEKVKQENDTRIVQIQLFDNLHKKLMATPPVRTYG